jgi:acyl carrier protein
MDIERQIGGFLIDNRKWSGSPTTLSSDYRLIDNDVLDSMGIFEMISFVEDHFGIQVEDDDLVPENFETISAIARLVSKRMPSEQ